MRSLHDPWTIGDLEIPNRVMLAPLAGIGNWFVRLQAKRYGAGLAVSEMISSFAIHYGNAKTLNELLVVHPEEGPVAIQLFGHDPEVMRSAAAEVARVGASILDLNMGCPVPKVMKTGAGAAMIKDPDLAVAVARAAREGSGLPVTVKLRASVKAGGMEGLELARRLVDEAGVAGITFHPRSAAVRHKGVPDYDLAAKLAASLPAPVILTGGLRDRDAVLEAYEHTGAAAVMLARGSLGNPWLFEELLGRRTENPSADEILDELDWMMDASAEHFGPERAARWMRKAYPWYMDRLGAGKEVQARLQATDSLVAAHAVLSELRPLLHCAAVPA